MLYYSWTDKNTALKEEPLYSCLEKILGVPGKKKRVLVVPPDFSRHHSGAGIITEGIHRYYGDALAAIIPALGTHSPMTPAELKNMFGEVPEKLFKVHDWKNNLATLGRVPAGYIREISGGAVDFDWPAQLNKELLDPGYDLILSVGQVVPHEVIGMANYNKNLFVGLGGSEGIHKSHYLGAAYGMERILGRADNPVRKVFNYASRNFCKNLPVVYLLTVVNENGICGLFAGDDDECFWKAAELSRQVNICQVEKPLTKAIVYLEPGSFKSTWLGNKSIYRTRKAMAAGGELVVIAPGVKEFGEDMEIDRLIRKYGYLGRERILELVAGDPVLQNNLASAAHLIHGSADGRFSVTYCPGHLSKEEIESVNYNYGDPGVMMDKYNVNNLNEGYNTLPGGEEVYYISNPALGLWEYSNQV